MIVSFKIFLIISLTFNIVKSEEKKLHLRFDVEEEEEDGLEHPPSRVIWIPHVNTNDGSNDDTNLANTIVLSHGKTVRSLIPPMAWR